jgi:DNA-binding Xre family transcriptional regulator
MKFSEKANIWMGLQMAVVIVEGQENNKLQGMALAALKSTLELLDENGSFVKRKTRSDSGRKREKADFLNALLVKNNITQQELASALDVRQQSVSQWQENKRIPRKRFNDVCDFLSATEDEKVELLKMQNGLQ